MGPEPLSLAVFTALLNVELSAIEDRHVRLIANRMMIPPRPATLMYESSNKDVYVAWRFAETPDQKNGAAYCDRGSAFREAQWGVINPKSDYFGQEKNWYPSVNDLMETWVKAWSEKGRSGG